jgi:NAD(P)-dependent dehydrogenase (short-subunit alcohol dehydrogenase family)
VGRVDGKVAIVTGAASGIGAASAALLAAEGAAVAVVDVDADGARDVVARITRDGGSAIAVTADVSDESQVRTMVAATVAEYGALHVLVNNAALVEPGHFARDVGVVDLDVEVWDRVMAVNVRSVMLGCKHAIPRMIEAGGGSIVNMSSGSARLGDFVRTAYGSSKAAINTLTKYVATQHGRDRVRVNAVAPGLVLTPPAFANLTPEHRERLESNLLTPFVGEPVDVAAMVLYLASDESRYVTGQVLPVNGGQSAHQPTYAQQLEARRRG